MSEQFEKRFQISIRTLENSVFVTVIPAENVWGALVEFRNVNGSEWWYNRVVELVVKAID